MYEPWSKDDETKTLKRLLKEYTLLGILWRLYREEKDEDRKARLGIMIARVP